MTGADPRTFAALLRHHRLASGLTQQALAERAGLSVRGISDLERAVNRAPYVATIVRLSKALQLSVAERAELESSISRLRGQVMSNSVVGLPAQITSLIGREADIDSAVRLIRGTRRRLLTLIGPGGVGKTRVALGVAAVMVADFETRVIFVPLEEVAWAGGVLPAIATALRVRDKPSGTLEAAVVEYLKDREVMMVLDGFEHLMEAATIPARMLAASPKLTMLVTSRTPLHIRGEQELEVRPLPVPGPDVLDDLESYSSVALFIERARTVSSNFALTPDTARTIAEICRRLDGLPLAIELAAARIKLLSPRSLLAQLESQLNVLTGGPRDSPPRHQTMRRTIAWSYDILADDIKAIFCRLAIFNAPFGAEVAGAVCQEPGGGVNDAQDGLFLLADSSLLSVHEGSTGEPRYSMLETVREYGLQMLDESGKGQAALKRLATYCVELAETAESELNGVDQAAWMARLERDHGALLLALRWTRESCPITGLRIAGALWRFWYSHGYPTEGRRHLDALLATVDGALDLPAAVQAKAVRGAAVLAAVQADYERADRLGEQGARIYRDIGDIQGEAAMLLILGSTAYYQGNYPLARTRYEGSLSLFRQVGDEQSISVALNNLANVAKEQGRIEAAVSMYEESLEMKRRLRDSRGIAIALNNLGTIALANGQYDRAVDLGEQGLQILRDLKDKDLAAAVDTVARAALHGGRTQRAAALYQEGLNVSWRAGDRELIAFCLEGIALVAATEGKMERAGTLYGAGEALRTAVGATLSPSEAPLHRESLDAVKTALGQESFARTWDLGSHMDVDTAVHFALERCASRRSVVPS